jgi:hypothetical protein
MTLQEFVEQALSDNKEYVEEVRKLLQILDRLDQQHRQNELHVITFSGG